MNPPSETSDNPQEKSTLASQGQVLRASEKKLDKPTSTGSGQAKRKLPLPKIIVAGLVILISLFAFGLIAYLMINQNKSQMVNDNSSIVNETPSPTPESTFDWEIIDSDTDPDFKTLKNNTNGYTVDYPAYLSARCNESPYEECLIEGESNGRAAENRILIEVIPAVNELRNASYHSKNVNDFLNLGFGESYAPLGKPLELFGLIRIEDMTVDGIQARVLKEYDQMWELSPDTTRRKVIVEKDNNIYIIDGLLESKDISIEQFSKLITTFKFTDTSEVSSVDTSDWKTYTNNEYGFSIKFPTTLKGYEGEWKFYEFTNNSGKIEDIGFGPPNIGDHLWAVNINPNNNIETVISKLGNQFSDRNETREKISISGNPALLVTVTTNQVENWGWKNVVIKKGNNVYSISNGAIDETEIDNSEFEKFYNSFQFTE